VSKSATSGHRSKSVKAAFSAPVESVGVDGVGSDRTRQRLIETAGQLFADQGFERTSIREIVAHAGANVAAVTYHFGGKLQLYEATIGYYIRASHEKFPTSQVKLAGSSSRVQLKLFVHFFLQKLLDCEKPAWHARLVAREMAEPTPVLDRIIQQMIRPTMAIVQSIVSDVLGPSATRQLVDRSAMAVISTCVFYQHSKPVLSRMFPEHSVPPANITHLADDLSEFCWGGLMAIRRRLKKVQK